MFDSVADTYDDVGVLWFTPIARRLVRELEPAPGERALDAGCGRGAALFALADAVGDTGHVTGIDLSRRMVDATRRDARARGLAHLAVHRMDASSPPLPTASYDLAVASFVLFFLPAPVAALRSWRALLVPGGRLGLATFTDSDAGWLNDVFCPYLPRRAFGGAASPYGSDGGVERLVTAGGFERIRTVGFPLDVCFSGAEQWYAWSLSHGQRAVWERIPPADRDRVRAAAAQRLERARDVSGRIRLTQRIRLTLAEAPLNVEQPAARAPT